VDVSVVLNYPLLAVSGIGALGLLALGAFLAGPRHHPRAGRWIALLGLILVGLVIVCGLVLVWLTQFTQAV
jgi:hypothetical protein